MLRIPLLLLLVLQLTYGALPRSHHGLDDDAPDVTILPCNVPGCQKGSEGKIFAFSALHDVILKEVALFVDIASEDDPQEMAVECLFWADLPQGKEPIKVDGKAVWIWDYKHHYAPYTVKCRDPVPLLKTTPIWAGLALDHQDTQVRLLIEQIGVQQKGTVGACNGPITSDRFDLTYEWLHHHTKLGIEGFTMYLTRQAVQWDSDKPKATEADSDTLTPFSYPGVTWMQFEHLSKEDRFYFSQTTLYNDCVYRLRHEYQYLLMFDMDEFLIIRDTRFTGKSGVKSFLHHSFTTQSASLGIFRYAYRDDCKNSTHTEPDIYHDRFTHRLWDSESKRVLGSNRYADKLIIKPDRVDILYVHWVVSARPGYTPGTLNAQPSMAILKHLRNWGQDCEELTEELPFDQE